MSRLPQQEDELFDQARQMTDPAARTRYLADMCGSDVDMRQRLEELLAASDEAETFFEETRSKLDLPAPPPAELADVTPTPGEETIGSRIGRYKLVQKLGEGGCGVVYLAEQEEPVRRRVALKIIKLGMETRSVIARFEAERQALAMMDHPNIARVFDAGATERGSPYFVMELVTGVKMTTYCDRHRLNLAQRLDLFIQICHAIQHAHQKGIIHGDIKPSNILVASQDGVPVPKVIDFGISRATEARLTDAFFATAYTQLVGTPAYMSPEQANLSPAGIDTRSDIYSLGVVLYELLTGKTPFEQAELLADGIEGMRRILREKEPPRPSARLQSLGMPEAIRTAGSRCTDAARLLACLRGDLDWVVMKALEKDRQRRYETANGLAMDLRRHLDDEPVMARPAGWTYRFTKLVRRNRVVFIAGAAVALALLCGTATSTWLLLKERDARRRAVAAEQQQARLRHAAETREQITQAALLVAQERHQEADLIVAGLDINQPTVEGAAVLRAIGEWYALQANWVAAADRFQRLLAVNSIDNSDRITLDYLECGPPLLELGNPAAYEAFRDAAIARFSDAPCPAADRIVKISLLMPAPARTLQAMESLAADTARYHIEAERNGDLFQAAWQSLSLALYEYRRGNYTPAVEWAQRCLAYPGPNAPRNVTAQIILALSFQQMGRMDEARAEWLASRQVIDARFRTGIDNGTPVQGFWFDWLFARILLREANEIFEPRSHPDGD